MVFSGCTSILSRKNLDENERTAFYPGTYLDGIFIHDAISETIQPTLPEASWDIPPCCFNPPLFVLSIIDMPLSFVADTICLPYDSYRAIKRSKMKAQPCGAPVSRDPQTAVQP